MIVCLHFFINYMYLDTKICFYFFKYLFYIINLFSTYIFIAYRQGLKHAMPIRTQHELYIVMLPEFKVVFCMLSLLIIDEN